MISDMTSLELVAELLKRGNTPQDILDMVDDTELVVYISDVEAGTRFAINEPDEFDGFQGVYMKLESKNHLDRNGIFSVNLSNGKVWRGDVVNGIEVIE